MDLGSTLAVALVMGLFGVAVLAVLWPGEKNARTLLGKWGIREPTADEVTVATGYLRRRRFWYPWLFLALPVIGQATALGRDPGSLAMIGGTLLLGGLLAELFAQRPTRGTRREAVLEHRGVLDFTPAWMLIVAGAIELGFLGFLVASGFWALLAVAAGGTAASWAIVLLSVRRPAAGTRRVDLALRYRSARVALGLGIGTTATMCPPVSDMAGFVAAVAAAVAFLAIVSPPGTLPEIVAKAG